MINSQSEKEAKEDEDTKLGDNRVQTNKVVKKVELKGD